MRTRRGITVAEAVLLLLVLAFVMVAVIGAANDVNASQRCHASGYPKAIGTFPFSYYCVKIVNQTDIVVPLDSIR